MAGKLPFRPPKRPAETVVSAAETFVSAAETDVAAEIAVSDSETAVSAAETAVSESETAVSDSERVRKRTGTKKSVRATLSHLMIDQFFFIDQTN